MIFGIRLASRVVRCAGESAFGLQTSLVAESGAAVEERVPRPR